MALRFRSGSSMPRSAARETGTCVDPPDPNPLPARERLHHLIPFAATEQAVVDEDPGDPVTDGPMEQGRRHRGVDAARKSEQHPALLAHPFTDRGHGLRDDVGRGPDRRTAADPVHEALEDRGALAGMSDLGMELEAVEPARGVRDAGNGRVRAGGDGAEPVRQGGHPIAVAHPDVEQPLPARSGAVLDPAQEVRMAAGAELRHAELARVGRLDHAAEAGRHRLHPVADPEHRDPGGEHRLGDREAAAVRHRLRSAREHDAPRPEGGERVFADVARSDLAVDAGFANPAGDEPGVLRAEVEDEDAPGVVVGGGGRGARRRRSSPGEAGRQHEGGARTQPGSRLPEYARGRPPCSRGPPWREFNRWGSSGLRG